MLDLSVPIVREASKCIKCMRCIQVCDKIQGMHIWDVAGTGSRTTVDVSYNRYLKNTDCAFCGQCVTHCPTGALTARDDTNKVLWRPGGPGDHHRGPGGPGGPGGLGGGIRPELPAGAPPAVWWPP